MKIRNLPVTEAAYSLEGLSFLILSHIIESKLKGGGPFDF